MQRVSLATLSVAALVILAGVTPAALASPITYLGWLSNEVAVTGNFSAPQNLGGINTSQFYKMSVASPGYGVGLSFKLSGSDRDINNLLGRYNIFFGTFANTDDLPQPVSSELIFRNQYQGSYFQLGGGDYTIALNAGWSAYYEPTEDFTYSFYMFGIEDKRVSSIPEPGSFALLLCALLVARFVATRKLTKTSA